MDKANKGEYYQSCHKTIKFLMSNHDGRVFLKSLIETAGIFRGTHSPDINVVMFNEGKRSFGLSLIDLMNKENPHNLSNLLKGE